MGLFSKEVKMVCPNCGHNWTMAKSVYLCTPYVQRGVNSLFVCSKCVGPLLSILMKMEM